jgi:branched-chain amino acid transport system permease protein
MRTTHRLWLGGSLLLLATAAVGAAGVGGAAAASPVRVTHQAWAATGPIGVPNAHPGEVYVSTIAGQPQAEALVELSGDAASVAGATLTLHASSDSTTTPQTTPQLVACPTTTPITGDGELSSAPATDCTVHASLSADSSGATWTVSLGPLASRIASGAGLAIQPLNAAPDSFTLGFDTARTAVSVLSQPAVAAAAPVTVAGPPPLESPVPLAPAERTGPPPTQLSPQLAAISPPAIGSAPAAAVAASPRTASSPSPLLVFVAVGIVALVGAWLRRRARPAGGQPAVEAPSLGRLLTPTGWTFLIIVALGLLFSDVTAYRLGSLLILFVAAIGLHLLVNGAGELSLAQAAVIGLSAFLSGQISAHAGISPIYCLPIAVAIGAATNLMIGLPALRARGLQVALVTLAAALAINQYLFQQSWVIGPPNGLQLPAPSLFGLQVYSDKAKLVFIAAVTVAAGLAANMLLNSGVGRAFAFVRSSPDAAAAAGVPVAAYRLAAFGVAGAFAGLAAGLYLVQVQGADVNAFPINDGLQYLIIAVLAGRGGLAGLVCSVALISGGHLFLGNLSPGLQTVFNYLGPLALIVNLAIYRRGFNGAIATARDGVRDALARRARPAQPRFGRPAMDEERKLLVSTPSLTVIAATAAIVAGIVMIALAWYHTGNTNQQWIQNQEIVSGGLGGMACIVVGSALLIRDALLRGRIVAPASPANHAHPLDGDRADTGFDEPTLASDLPPAQSADNRRRPAASRRSR